MKYRMSIAQAEALVAFATDEAIWTLGRVDLDEEANLLSVSYSTLASEGLLWERQTVGRGGERQIEMITPLPHGPARP